MRGCAGARVAIRWGRGPGGGPPQPLTSITLGTVKSWPADAPARSVVQSGKPPPCRQRRTSMPSGPLFSTRWTPTALVVKAPGAKRTSQGRPPFQPAPGYSQTAADGQPSSIPCGTPVAAAAAVPVPAEAPAAMSRAATAVAVMLCVAPPPRRGPVAGAVRRRRARASGYGSSVIELIGVRFFVMYWYAPR